MHCLCNVSNITCLILIYVFIAPRKCVIWQQPKPSQPQDLPLNCKFILFINAALVSWHKTKLTSQTVMTHILSHTYINQNSISNQTFNMHISLYFVEVCYNQYLFWETSFGASLLSEYNSYSHVFFKRVDGSFFSPYCFVENCHGNYGLAFMSGSQVMLKSHCLLHTERAVWSSQGFY